MSPQAPRSHCIVYLQRVTCVERELHLNKALIGTTVQSAGPEPGSVAAPSDPLAFPLTFQLSLAPAYLLESKFCHFLKVNYFYAKQPPVFGDTYVSPANGKSWHQHLKMC